MRSDCALTSFLSIISVSCLFRHLHVKLSPSHHWLLCMDKQVAQAHSHKPVKLKFLFIRNHLFRKIQLTRNCNCNIVQFCRNVCVRTEKRLLYLCGAEAFVAWDLSLKALRCCKPSKSVRQDHTLQRLSSKRLYLHHISSCFSHSLSCYVLKLTACTKIMLKYSLVNTWGKQTPFTQCSFTQFAFSLPLNIEANRENQL